MSVGRVLKTASWRNVHLLKLNWHTNKMTCTNIEFQSLFLIFLNSSWMQSHLKVHSVAVLELLNDVTHFLKLNSKCSEKKLNLNIYISMTTGHFHVLIKSMRFDVFESCRGATKWNSRQDSFLSQMNQNRLLLCYNLCM